MFALSLNHSASEQTAAYRRDIDGLRAVAILPVVLYHMGIPWFAGGFVGVDVFFVISGFLITGVIAREMEEDRFSIARFYVRRAKRILPALLVVLAATLLLGLFLCGPTDLKSLGKSTAATALSVSNILFRVDTNYFTAAEIRPLLMTWSLGVEEQFYLLWPVTLALLVRWRLPRLRTVLLLGIASLAMSVWGVLHAPAAAFYLLPPRAWELLMGAALALAPRPMSQWRVPSLARDAASVAGLLLVVLAVVLYQNDTPFPGFAALVPCAGAALLIASGEQALVNRCLLARRVPVFIGLVSYSLYLWHWPLLSFGRMLYLGELPRSIAVVAGVSAFALAALTWHLVEQPFRRATTLRPSVVLLRFSLPVVGLALLGGLVWLLDGIPARLPKDAAAADSARSDKNVLHEACRQQSGSDHLPNPRCMIGPTGPKQVIAVWGDSHADAIAPAIEAWAAREGRGFAQVTNGGCPGLVGANIIEGRLPLPDCPGFSQRALEAVTQDPRIGVVVLAGRWALYAETSRYGREGGGVFHLTDEVSSDLTLENSRRAFAAALRRSVARIVASGRTVVIVGQVPEVGFDVPDCFVRVHMSIGGSARSCSHSARMAAERGAFVNKVIADVAAEFPGVSAVFPAPVLCHGEECVTSLGGVPLYVDDDHLSRTGALYVGERMGLPKLSP